MGVFVLSRILAGIFSRHGTNKWGQDIHTWLITMKALDERYALYIAYNVNHLMVRTGVLHPTPADVAHMQAWIVKGDRSKGTRGICYAASNSTWCFGTSGTRRATSSSSASPVAPASCPPV